MAERDLVVRIIGDDRDLQRAFASSERRAKGFQAQITGLGGTLTRSFLAAGVAAGGTATAFALLGDAVDTAVDLNEQIARTEVILGDSAQATIEWSRTTSDALGISQREALAASATFAGLFETVGVGREEAAGLSRDLVQLAADLASLQNSSPEEALLALRSGLAGESEPLRRFNIFLSEARVQQVAMAESGKQNAKELTNQEKALARYNIILRDSVPAQGNFAATSGELANQSRILRANLDDLSARIGNVLVPVLSDATEAALLLFDALDKFRGVDFSPGFDFPDLPFGDFSSLALLPISPAAAYGLAIKKLIEDEEKVIKETQALSPGRAIGEHIAKVEEERAAQMEKAKLEADRAQRRQRAAFSAFVRGMGLKLDKAALTENLDDDIAVLRELERAILRQIEREGRTFKLVDQLTQVRLQLQSLTAQRAEDAAERSRDAFQNVLDSLDLKLQAATATAGFQDDLRALQAIENVLIRRIQAEGSTLDLERELLDVRQRQADVRQQQAEALRDARQGRQFEAIGLTETGDERVPGVGALRGRLATLEEQIKGTALDTEKTRSQLARISRVLSGQFGEVGREVRSAILQMFNDIADALEEGTGRDGPLTKFEKTGTGKLLEGIGLSDAEIRELRQRLAQVGPGGTVPGQGIGAFGFGFPTTDTTGRGGGNIIINGDIIVDGGNPDAIVSAIQKKAQRSAGQRRGTRAGGGVAQ